MHLQPRLYLALALVLLVVVPALVPLAGADQQPPGSGNYYHVGDNQLARPTTTIGGFATPTCPLCALDGNQTSYADFGNVGFSASNCNQRNFTVAPAAPVRADLVRVTLTLSLPNQAACVTMGVNLQGGGSPVIFPTTNYGIPFANGAQPLELWVNWTATANVSSFWINVGEPQAASGGSTFLLREIEAFDKNATTSDPVRAIANHAAANVECYAAGAAASNFGSNLFVAPQGTFYVMVPAIMPSAATSTPNPMQISSGNAGVSSTFYGWSRVVRDVTGARTDAVAVWQVTTTQPGLSLVIKPAGSGNVNATDTVCRFARPEAMFSSTYANGYVTAPLTAWGGTSADLWGILYDVNSYPVNSLYDSDLNGQTGLFRLENMSFGGTAFPTGALGQSNSVSLSTLPFGWAGNGFFVVLGQSTSAASDSSKYGLTVNGRPAQAVTSGASTTNAFQYALFYVDDVAARNGLDNSAGNVGQSAYRPLASETFQLTLGSGYDPNAPVFFGNTHGRDGHAGLACLTICSANVQAQTFVLPSRQTNVVRFNVTDETGAPLAGVRILLTENASAQTTDENGSASFPDLFFDAHFDLFKNGYQRLCVDYVFRNRPGTESGTHANGCPYIGAFNVSFSVTMASLQSLGLGSNGSLIVNGSVPLAITFSGNFTALVPAKVNFTILRTTAASLWVDQVLLDLKTGTYRRVASPAPWDENAENVFPFLYPTLKAQTDARDGGTYLAFVTDGNGTYLAGQSFCIVTSWPPLTSCNETIHPSDQLRIAQDSAAAIAQQQVIISRAKSEAVQEQAVDYVAGFVVFAFRPDFGIPNFAVWLIWAALLFALGIARGR